MKDFTPEAWANFEEGMADRYDFKQCKRRDGTYYGIRDDYDCGSGATELKPGSKEWEKALDAEIAAFEKKNKADKAAGKPAYDHQAELRKARGQ